MKEYVLTRLMEFDPTKKWYVTPVTQNASSFYIYWWDRGYNHPFGETALPYCEILHLLDGLFVAKKILNSNNHLNKTTAIEIGLNVVTTVQVYDTDNQLYIVEVSDRLKDKLKELGLETTSVTYKPISK